jgi:hypothetical protein
MFVIIRGPNCVGRIPEPPFLDMTMVTDCPRIKDMPIEQSNVFDFRGSEEFNHSWVDGSTVSFIQFGISRICRVFKNRARDSD